MIILIFCSNFCWFFLCDEYEMIMPLMTALPVSQSVDGEISGDLIVSRKDAHSFLINVVKSLSSRSDVLRCHLIEGL